MKWYGNVSSAFKSKSTEAVYIQQPLIQHRDTSLESSASGESALDKLNTVWD
jgi:hypothetical protein